MNILITGGAGYVGTALCDALDAHPRVTRITVFDALIRGDRRFFQRSAPYRKVAFVHGDVLDTRALEAACRGHQAVVHLAAFVDEPYHHSQHVQYDQANGYGTLSVVRALERLPEVQRAIYLSSTAVYGFRQGLAAHSPPAPENGYGQSKLLGEGYFAQLAAAGKDAHTVRSAQIFGPNRSMRFDSVMHAFMFEALSNGCVRVYGDGQQHRAFVALSAVVEALVQGALGEAPVPALLADFQCTIGALLDWLTATIPSTEYRYLTPNVPLPGQSFTDLPGLDSAALTAAWDAFVAGSAIRGPVAPQRPA